MTELLLRAAAVALLVSIAFAASWCARRMIRLLTRRAVRLARERPGVWRVRLRRLAELEGDADARKRQRADAAARMLGHAVTVLVFVTVAIIGLHALGVDPVYAISSAGFIGLAIALSGQELIRDLLAGTIALLEDRYAVGDDVEVTVSGLQTRGTVDLVGAASIRIRTSDGATWHTGHSSIESVTNHSQLAASAEISVATSGWMDGRDQAARRLAEASNDHGLTGVVFLPDLDAHPEPSGTTTLTVRSNRPLTNHQRWLVRERLVGRQATVDQPDTGNLAAEPFRGWDQAEQRPGGLG